MIPIALVGAAHIHTPRFVDLLLGRRDVRVELVWDHEADRARRTASRLGAAVARDLDEVWETPGIAAVIICSETDRHGGLVRAAARASKHLFVEKPLAISATEAASLAQAIEEAGVLFSTGYLKRSLGVHRALREAIAAGRLGRIMRIDVSVTHAGALWGWFDGEWAWMQDRKQAGFGALGDMGSHGVDLLLWLLGHRVEVLRVSAWTGSASGHARDVEELGCATLELTEGAVATLWTSWADLAEPVELRVAGTEAYASVAAGRLTFIARDATADRPVAKEVDVPVPEDLPHPLELFIDAVVTGSPRELVTPAEAVRSCDLVEAILRSASRRAWLVPSSGASTR